MLLAVQGPLPPGCLQTVWGDGARCVKIYWSSIPGRQMYNTFDWGARDADGVANHLAVAEVAVVGVADSLTGQVAVAFVVLKDPSLAATEADALALEGAIMKVVDEQLGAVARPARVHFVHLLPQTRSGKLLRRSIQAFCEGRDPGDLTTLDDPSAQQQIRDLMRPGSRTGAGELWRPLGLRIW